MKVARRVRRGESGNLQIVGGIAVKHPEDKQGARPLPNLKMSEEELWERGFMEDPDHNKVTVLRVTSRADIRQIEPDFNPYIQ